MPIALFGCGSGKEVVVAPSEPAAAPVKASGPSLDQVAKQAPALLYFIKTDCGSNSEAVPLVQALYEANKESGKFFVVMNADAEEAAKWSQENKTTFPIIPDPDMQIIGKYKVDFSQTGVMVDGELKESKRFPGYGRKTLEDLNKSLGGEAGPAKVDLSTAPERGFG